jgi:uncharacterized protein DUF2785
MTSARKLLIAAATAAGVASSFASCPPTGTSTPSLQALKRVDWIVADDAARAALATSLLGCLADPDPVRRDDLAFDALSHWMRARQLAPETMQSMRVALLVQLEAGSADGDGFARPFAALVLAEIARADRLHPFLSAAERFELVRAGAEYLASVRDYRGFDSAAGWRHGVAHGADLMLQLALNPALDRGQIDAILAAIASQVVAANAHFYVYGEGDRLMAPVFYIGRRALLSADDWQAWLTALASKVAKPAVPTQASLAARHDLAAFLLPLYVSLKESGDAQMQARMLPSVTAALKAID